MFLLSFLLSPTLLYSNILYSTLLYSSLVDSTLAGSSLLWTLAYSFSFSHKLCLKIAIDGHPAPHLEVLKRSGEECRSHCSGIHSILYQPDRPLC